MHIQRPGGALALESEISVAGKAKRNAPKTHPLAEILSFCEISG